jgi:hypothetical protein
MLHFKRQEASEAIADPERVGKEVKEVKGALAVNKPIVIAVKATAARVAAARAAAARAAAARVAAARAAPVTVD